MYAVIALILISTALTLSAGATQSEAAASKSEPRQGTRQDAPKPAKPKVDPPDAKQSPSYRPGQAPSSRELLEERLRRGQMDEPTAQGQVSDRLEQFYRGSGETGGKIATEQPESK